MVDKLESDVGVENAEGVRIGFFTLGSFVVIGELAPHFAEKTVHSLDAFFAPWLDGPRHEGSHR